MAKPQNKQVMTNGLKLERHWLSSETFQRPLPFISGLLFSTTPLPVYRIYSFNAKSCQYFLWIYTKSLFSDWLDLDYSLDLPWCLDVVWLSAFDQCLFHDLDIGFWFGFCNKPPTHGFSRSPLSCLLIPFHFLFSRQTRVLFLFFFYTRSHIVHMISHLLIWCHMDNLRSDCMLKCASTCLIRL